ncbi:hypothetical protein MNBD_PLANCTO02-2501 [hydrothermal vent metagenome]|uniref:Zinc-finger domain-containing protein n=1 Tax=hydrothermal vent metagenome TaxID=652676 RepID=A0A3B1DH87_9ZZZZ
MEKLSRLTPDQRSDLVAYLDGELGAKESEGIEKVLTTSPVARSEVEALSKTWKLLDYLPQAKASQEFTKRTISQVKVDTVTRPPINEQQWFVQTRRGLIAASWLIGLTLMSLLGFSITNRWIQDPSTQLVKELPVIENMDIYREIGTVDFLDELKKSGLFDESSLQDK